MGTERTSRPAFGTTAETETEGRFGQSSKSVLIPAGAETLSGDLIIPSGAPGVVLFAHGSGSSRKSPRNRLVAETIQKVHLGTLLFDLLTPEEERLDAARGHLRFNINLLAQRLLAATRWIANQPVTKHLGLGYFGASTGAAAALVAAAELGPVIDAVVSRGGRPDLGAEALPHIEAPTLLIVGERDDVVVQLNEQAYRLLRCEKDFAVVPNATHLFEEPGALEEVAALAANWFQRYLKPR